MSDGPIVRQLAETVIDVNDLKSDAVFWGRMITWAWLALRSIALIAEFSLIRTREFSCRRNTQRVLRGYGYVLAIRLRGIPVRMGRYSMTRIMLTGAGGRLGVVHARALKNADPSLHLIGVDADPFRLQRALTHEKYLIPRSSDPDFVPAVRAIVEQTGANLLLTNVTADIPAISAARERVGCRVFLPDHATIMLCEDKVASNRIWQNAGVPVPRSMAIATRVDLEKALEQLGPEIWLRAVSGSGATGALPVSNLGDAVHWLELNNGWGRFMAAELLGTETVSWESIWRDGELIVAQARKRLFWEFGRISMSGVSGIAGAGETVADPEVDRIAMAAVSAVTSRPNGVLGVDLAYDKHGDPMVTEINAGRFMSGGVCHFAAVDINIPSIAVKVALGDDTGFAPPLVNPMNSGLIFVSGLDNEPVFTTHDSINKLRDDLSNTLKVRTEAQGCSG